MASYKTASPEGEPPPDQCPVCLEPWDTESRLPKFLMCHHSICVTCAGEMQKTAKKRIKQRNEGSVDGTQERSASRASLDSLDNVLEDGQSATWVRCPMCRTRTFIEDPYMLQTNFYLNGLSHSVSIPRLVLWCETCSVVATPDCGDHILRPTGEKMRELQDELARRANVVHVGVNESLSAHESHMEVYRWLCGMLRHAHSKVLAALTHAAQYHQALQFHTDALRTLVQRGEQLQFSDDPEDVIDKLTTLLKELDVQQSAINSEVELPILKDTFQILRTHQGPQGYSKALVVLDANKSVSLSLFGENDRQQQSCTSDEETEEMSDDAGTTLMRAMSLHASRRKMKNKQAVMMSVDKKSAPTSQIPITQTTIIPLKHEVVVSAAAESQETPRDAEEEVSSQEPIESVVKTQETTAPPITMSDQPDGQTLQRNGDFGRGTVSMAYRRYPSHLYDEEPITDPSTIVTDNKDIAPAEETVTLNDDTEERAVDTGTPEEENNDRNEEYNEEHGHQRSRNHRKKRRQRPPSVDGDVEPRQRSRRESTRRRRNKKKANKPMCVIA